MRASGIALAALALAFVVPAAPAAHGCLPSASQALLSVGPGARDTTTFYVVIDSPTPSDLFIPLPWIYEETNGRDALQRHDDWRDDTCGGEYAGDMLIF